VITSLTRACEPKPRRGRRRRPGEQRRDVDADLGEHDEGDQRQEDDQNGGPQQRQELGVPGRCALYAGAVDRAEVALDRRAEISRRRER